MRFSIQESPIDSLIPEVIPRAIDVIRNSCGPLADGKYESINNKSPGPDGIHPLVLKHCSHELAPILKVIFTQSLNTGSIPSDWLMANITPVYKKGNKDLPVNYRPISLTSVCSKVMEHVI